MSQKKLKRSKGGNKPSKRKIPELDVLSGEGFYGMVEKVLGDKIVSVKLNDGTTRQAKIPGKFFKKVWLKNGSKVLINNDMEIVHVIRENDIKSAEADRMLRTGGGDDYNIFQNYSDSDDDDDENNEDEKNQEIKKLDNIGKTKELLARKEKDKIKDLERKGGRVMRNADEIEKDMSEFVVNNSNNNNNSKETNVDDFNIDDI